VNGGWRRRSDDGLTSDERGLVSLCHSAVGHRALILNSISNNFACSRAFLFGCELCVPAFFFRRVCPSPLKY
jgi:hypothetical protein